MSHRVTLTFDNGPTPGITESVLDELRDRDLRATFFVVGQDLERPGARALIERALSEGHWVGNHTLTHSLQFGESADPEFGVRELLGAQAMLDGLAHPDRLFRPYGGGGIISRLVLTPEVVRALQDGAYTCVLWNCVPHDWDEPDAWVQNALATIDTQAWSVVVLHDKPDSVMPRLPELLDALTERDIEFRQDFPDDCVPIWRGEIRGPLDHLYVAASEA